MPRFALDLPIGAIVACFAAVPVTVCCGSSPTAPSAAGAETLEIQAEEVLIRSGALKSDERFSARHESIRRPKRHGNA
jgi:hypothetical protein